MTNNTKSNLVAIAFFVAIFCGIYFIRSFYPEVWQALGTLLYFVIILVFVMFVVWTFFFSNNDEKETTPRMKIIKSILFGALVLLAMWWLSNPMDIIYDPSASLF